MWRVAAAASIAAWVGACLAPDAQPGKAAGSSSGGTPGGSGGGGGGGGEASTDVSATWVKPYGSGSSQAARAIAADASGNVIVGGIYAYETLVMDPVTLPNAQQTDAFVAKLTPDGEVLWARGIGGAGDQTLHGLAVDPKDGTIVIAGIFNQSLDTMQCELLSGFGGSDVFVVKLSPDDGSCLWSRAFGDAAEQSAFSLAIDASQNIVVAGTFTGTLDFGPPTAPLMIVDDPDVNGDFTEIFVARLDMDGKPLSSRSIGDAAFNPMQTSLGVAVDTLNDIVVTGSFEGGIATPGDPIYNQGQVDLFLTKLKADSLATAWSLTSGDAMSSTQYGRVIAVDPSNTIYFGGYYTGEISLNGAPIPAGPDLDVFLAAVDPLGKPLWGKRIGGIGNQYVTGLAVDASSDLLLGGMFSGVLDFGDGGTLVGSDVMPSGTLDPYVAKLSPGGDRIWSFQGTGPDQQYVLDVAPAPNGAYAAGWLQNSAKFGDISVASAGAEDIFILKLTD